MAFGEYDGKSFYPLSSYASGLVVDSKAFKALARAGESMSYLSELSSLALLGLEHLEGLKLDISQFSPSLREALANFQEENPEKRLLAMSAILGFYQDLAALESPFPFKTSP
ncbi:MAG: hypothetical protein R2865_05175 [Deinococcales bacterium]